MAARISSTMRCSTISAATPIALRIATAPLEPCEMMQTPSTPSSTAPPYVSGLSDVYSGSSAGISAAACSW